MLQSKEERYLLKVQNYLWEGLYEKFVEVILEAGDSIHLYGKSKDKFIALVDEGIKRLKRKEAPQNKLFIDRQILLCINKILFFDKDREDLKKLKKKIISEFISSEDELPEKISLPDQLTEIRLTFDLTYISYLLEKYFEKEDYLSALFCFEAIYCVEPDNDLVDKYYSFFEEKYPLQEPPKFTFIETKNMDLILDRNVVLSRILYDVGEYRISHSKTFNLEKLGNKQNQFIILPIIKEEIKKHIEAQKVKLKILKSKYKTFFDIKEIAQTLNKRATKTIQKYGCSQKFDDSNVTQVKQFFSKNIPLLRTILREKFNREKNMSHKLKRLGKRIMLLPEEGDILLLAQAIQYKKNTQKEVGILSQDTDFQYFAKYIEEEFGIRIVSDRCLRV